MNLCLGKILPWSDGNLFASGTPGIFQRCGILITLSLIFSWCETAAPVCQNATTAHKTSTQFAPCPSMKDRIERFCQTRWRKDNLAPIIAYTSSLAAGNSAPWSYCSKTAPPPRKRTFLHSPSCWPVLINSPLRTLMPQTGPISFVPNSIGEKDTKGKWSETQSLKSASGVGRAFCPLYPIH